MAETGSQAPAGVTIDIAQSVDGQSFAVLVDGKVLSTHETIAEAF